MKSSCSHFSSVSKPLQPLHLYATVLHTLLQDPHASCLVRPTEPHPKLPPLHAEPPATHQRLGPSRTSISETHREESSRLLCHVTKSLAPAVEHLPSASTSDKRHLHRYNRGCLSTFAQQLPPAQTSTNNPHVSEAHSAPIPR